MAHTELNLREYSCLVASVFIRGVLRSTLPMQGGFLQAFNPVQADQLSPGLQRNQMV